MAESPELTAFTARLDNLPASRAVWRLIILISLGACFEIYDLLQTAYISPGLVANHIFKADRTGLFNLPDQATFASATFLGLFIGTLVFSPIADLFGRRAIFTFSLLWYTAANLMMALQSTAVQIDVWRLIAGIGIGVELVTIDAYLSELAPKHVRGRAFAVSQFIQFLSVPVLALCSWKLVPNHPLGIAGWRWVVLLGSAAAVAVWFIRRHLPESPRWLADHGRLEEATAILDRLVSVSPSGHRVESRDEHPPATAQLASSDQPIPLSYQSQIQNPKSKIEFLRPPYLSRTLMLVIFNFFQTIGFYGFANWLPSLMAAQGTTVTKSLQYSAAIAITFPLAPLACTLIADRFERKWQIVFAALVTASAGLLFSRQSAALPLILLGITITASNNLLSYAYHAYQSELYPTRIRARAVGFVYSWSRLSTALTSLMIGFFLTHFGPHGVFAFIAAAMFIVILTIALLGPPTRNRSLEEIAR